MELSLQRPTVVITGAFNPAIFQPQWIAKHLCGYEIGATVEGTHVLVIENNVPQQVTFFENVGIHATTNRLLIYLNSIDKETVNFGEKYCLKIFEHLPHTPFQQLGINFQFAEPEPEDSIADKIESKEDLERHYEIKEQRFTSVIRYADNIDLNLQRTKSGEGLRFNFNYHHAQINPNNAKTLLEGSIERMLDHATHLLNSVYELSEHTITGFALDSDSQ